MPESERPLRHCDVCGQVDNHPRHVFVADPNSIPVNQDVLRAVLENADLTIDDRLRIIADVQDTSSQTRHMDCCREAGCPDGICSKVTAGAEDLRGEELIAHITGEGV